MDDLDAELRTLLTQAGGEPHLSRRAELLDALTARIDEGGVDVTDAPAPPPGFEPAGGTVAVTDRSRRSARVAGLGLGGWIAVGAVSAAAATGAWLSDGHGFTPESVPSVTSPVPAVIDAAEPGLGERVTVAPVRAGGLLEQADADVTSSTSIVVVEPRHDDSGANENIDGVDGRTLARDDAHTDGSAGAVGSGGDHQSTAGGGDAHADARLRDVDQAIEDTVDGLLPPGPVKDTVSPVIQSVNVNGLAGWLVTSLACGEDAPVSVAATDNEGVTRVSLEVSVGSRYTQSIPLTRGAGTSWSGLLAPVTAVELGLVSTLLPHTEVDINVSARDDAGNTATSRTTASVNALSCMGR